MEHSLMLTDRAAFFLFLMQIRISLTVSLKEPCLQDAGAKT